MKFGDDNAKVGVSIGSATYPYAGDSFDQLVIAADKGMYSNKIRRKHAAGVRLMIPKPDIPLDLEMPIGISPDDVEQLVVVDETNIYCALKRQLIHQNACENRKCSWPCFN